MDYLKKIGFGLLYTIIPVLILTIIVTLFHYFGIINKGLLSIMEIIIPSLSLFVGGFQIGKRSKQKGWLEGIKFSFVILVILIVLNIIFRNPMEIKNILYYFIILSLCVVGSMMGINKK